MKTLLIKRYDTGILKYSMPKNFNLVEIKSYKDFTFWSSNNYFYFDSKLKKLRTKRWLSLYISCNDKIMNFGNFTNIDFLTENIGSIIKQYNSDAIQDFRNCLINTDKYQVEFLNMLAGKEQRKADEKAKKLIDDEIKRLKDVEKLKYIELKLSQGGEDLDSEDILNFIKKYSTEKMHIRTIGSINKSWKSFSFDVNKNETNYYDVVVTSGRFTKKVGKASPKFPNFKDCLENAINNYYKGVKLL